MKVSIQKTCVGALCALFFLAAGCGSDQSSQPIDTATTTNYREIGSDAYVYGLPLAMAYKVMYQYSLDPKSGAYKAPFGTIYNNNHVSTPQDTAFPGPNADTPYSFLWMDLRAEPMVLSVPAVDSSRYYSVMLCDLDTFNFGYIGSRATGAQAGDYLVVGPDWTGHTPAGIQKVFRSNTQFSLAMYRTQLFNPADMPNVTAVQAGYSAQPLHTFLHQPAPPSAPAVDFPVINDTLLVKNLPAYIDFVQQFAPPGPEEIATRLELAQIGIGPFKRFEYSQLPDAAKAEVQLGFQDGDSKVRNYLVGGALQSLNGWTVSAFFGDRAFFHGDWLKRVAGDFVGIFGNDTDEAVYPGTNALPNGEVIDCSQHNYTLTFPSGQLPPVNAFWSVTMYDGVTMLLIDNPINRYLINTPMLPQLKTNADGSRTIYIQKDSPGPDKESNWLPAPNGSVYMVMRLYWPTQTPPSILPLGSGTWSPPPIVKVP